MRFFIDTILFSYAQIFFSNRRWFGAVIMISTFVFPQLGMMALLGVILSNLIAYLLKFDNEKIRSGFYGFNGILFGAASVYYYDLNFFLLYIIPVFIVLTFFISAFLEHYMAESFNLPGLSLPFILTLYIFIIFLSNYNNLHLHHIKAMNTELFGSLPQLMKNYFNSLSFILFQPNIISGIILAVGLLFFSRVLFLFSISSFLICMFFVQLIIPQQYDSYAIIYGFNAILTGFALGGSLIIPSRKSFLLVSAASLLIVIITGFFIRLMAPTILPVLVLPFNFIVLSAIYSFKFRKEQTDLVLLYFKPGSPEENLYYHNKRKSRFDRFKLIYPELPVFGEWLVTQAVDGQYTHKDDYKYAWDFEVVDENNSNYSETGLILNDYYSFKLPVSAPLDGEIVNVVDGIPDNKPGEVDLKNNWGNTIIIKHEYGLFSSLSHLEADSIKVAVGDKVKKGEHLASCGNSGRSPVPHIHLQFQVTDQLGDKTFQFPIAHYLEKSGDKHILHSFDYPAVNTMVSNLDIHKTIKNAFDLKLGNKLKFNCSLNGKSFEEEWEVKINFLNELYFESSKGSTAAFFLTKKIFYFTSFAGSRNSALYYFYLLAMKVPMCYHQNLVWEDVYSIDQLPGNAVRYFTEFLLIFKNFITAKGSFCYSELPEDSVNFIFKNEINVYGSGPLAFYNRKYTGSVAVNPDGEIEQFNFNLCNGKNFTAVIMKSEE